MRKHRLQTGKRRGVAAIGICCAAGMLMGGCAKEAQAPAATGVAVEVYAAAVGDIDVRSTYIGTLSAGSTVYVVPYVSGEMLEVNVKVGDTVVVGQVLGRIDDAPGKLQLDAANAQYDSAVAAEKTQLGGAWDAQRVQTQAGIDQLYSAINMYEEQLRDAKRQLDELDDNIELASDAMQAAQAAYAAAQTKYLTAANLATAFQGALAAYPALGTTAGLTAAYNDALLALAAVGKTEADALADPSLIANPMQSAAFSMHHALANVGITVEYITPTGQSAYQQEAKAAQAAYEAAYAQYSKLLSSEATLESSITQLKAAIEQAHINLSSTQAIYDITESRIKSETRQALESQVSAAGVGVESAELQLDFYTLTAPISGVVDSVDVTEHGLASSTSPAFSISNTNRMEVTLHVAENVKNILRIGQEVTVERAGNEYAGEIIEIGANVDPYKGLFMVKAAVDTAGDSLASGVSASVTARTSGETGALIVPYDAVHYEANQAYVFVAKEGIAAKTYIEAGLSDGERVAVLQGLSAGDLVISTWAASLKDGAEVTYGAPGVAVQTGSGAAPRMESQPAVLQQAASREEAPETQEEASPPEPPQVEITASGVNFRAEASTRGEALGKLEKGRRAVLLGEEGGWYHIALDGVEGYVSAEYAKRVEVDESAENPA